MFKVDKNSEIIWRPQNQFCAASASAAPEPLRVLRRAERSHPLPWEESTLTVSAALLKYGPERLPLVRKAPLLLLLVSTALGASRENYYQCHLVVVWRLQIMESTLTAVSTALLLCLSTGPSPVDTADDGVHCLPNLHCKLSPIWKHTAIQRSDINKWTRAWVCLIQVMSDQEYG